MTHDAAQGTEPSGISFSQFVFSEYQQAKIMLGHMANPVTGNYESNLDAARYLIEILDMLEEKTKGNLTDDEKSLMANVLHDLRMSFVHERQRAKDRTEEKKEEHQEDNPEDVKEKETPEQ